MKNYRTIVFVTLILVSCSNKDEFQPKSGTSSSWSVPKTELVSAAGKDAIQSIDAPVFSTVEEANYLKEDDLLLVTKVEDEVKAYSLNVLNWHEIVNDQIGDVNLAITYCPLTGTGIAWNREIDGHLTTFGVSGLLYNSNLVSYDRATNSYWSQIRMDCIHGDYIGRSNGYFPMIEMSWKSLKKMIPDALVLTLDTGFDLPYGSYPYYDYRTNHELFFVPVEFDNHQLPAKEKVLGVIVQNEAIVYPFSSFKPNEITVINELFKGQPMVVVGAPDMAYATAFKSNLDGATIAFFAIQDEGPIILSDNQGNKWNIFGEAVAGPRLGERLKPLKAINGYWFAWADFFPRVKIYK